MRVQAGGYRHETQELGDLFLDRWLDPTQLHELVNAIVASGHTPGELNAVELNIDEAPKFELSAVVWKTPSK